jgi:hypothetical protein
MQKLLLGKEISKYDLLTGKLEGKVINGVSNSLTIIYFLILYYES